jgi:general secretion pathway protein K
MKIRRFSNKQRSGIALVIVMLIVLVLGVVAGGFAYSMRVEMRLARQTNNDTDLEWLGRSGVELAKFVVGQKTLVPQERDFEALNQIWAGGPGTSNSPISNVSLTEIELGNGIIHSVKITDAERKFNLNLADQTLLQQALILIGVDAGEFPTIVDSIQDWIDRDDNNHLAGAETDHYMGLEPPYVAKNGLIDDISELLLIKGITPEIYWGSSATNATPSKYQPRTAPGISTPGEEQGYAIGMMDLFTPISGGRLNINTASAMVLQVIPDIDANTAAAILQFRAGPDGVDGTEDDTPFRNVGELRNVGAFSAQMISGLSRYMDVRSHTFQVDVDTEITGTKRLFSALIRRATTNTAEFATLQFFWK